MIKASTKVKLAMAVFAIVSFFTIGKASAADFNIIPSGSTSGLNQTLTVDIKINTASISINAAQGALKFDPAILQVKSISKTNSIFNFWLAEPTFSNTDGKIEFLGGTPNGVIGGALQALRIVFTTFGVGSSDLIFTDSAISAADGTGKNVISKANGASFVVTPGTGVPPKGGSPAPTPSGAIPSPEQILRTPAPATGTPSAPELNVTVYTDSTQWYDLDAPFTASWVLPADISGVSTLLNQSPKTEAPTKSEGLFTSKTFPELQNDGVYYLHVRFQNNKGWGLSAHYRIAMDTQPPLPFQIALTTGGLVSTDPAPTLSFGTGDSLSGIARYAIFINSEDVVYSSVGTYHFPPHPPGDYNVTVRAIDQADNSIEGKMKLEIVPIESPVITFITDKVNVGDPIRIKGSIDVNYKVQVSITDKNKALISQSEISPDSTGVWSFQLDRTLNAGNYYVSVTSVDSRGALSLPVGPQKISVNEVPIISLFGLGITLTDLTIFLLIVAIVILIYFVRRITLHQLKTSRGSFIIGRDLGNAMGQIGKEIDKIETRQARGSITGTQLSDNTVSIKKIRETIDKVNAYINKEIEGIK